MPDIASKIAENLAGVQEQIAEAAARCGRSAEEILLVAVTKYVGPAEIRALVEAGSGELGESRPQQLWHRAAELQGSPVHWHLVGPLQRNKIRRTLPLLSLVHSVDSLRLVAALEEAAAELGRRVPILLEVNTSGEPAKHGFALGTIEPIVEELAGYRHVAIRGLMCMASLEGGTDVARRDFAALRHYRDRLRSYCPDGISLDELSMGMSGDFPAAIEEGATMVRIGSALFAGIGHGR